jgi:cytochrome c peroxidase
MTMMTRTSWKHLLWTLALVGCGDSSTATPDAGKAIDAKAIDAAVAIDAPGDPLTPAQRTAVGQLAPLPAPPADPTNAHADDAKAATLGQSLFFDKSYAGALVVGNDGTNNGLGAVGQTGKVSCASCHAVGTGALDDQRSTPANVSLGIKYGTRNALGLVNSAYYTWSNWGGKFDSQWSLPLAVAEGAATMASNRLQIVHMIYDKYKAEYNAAFTPALDPSLDPTATDASRFPATGKPGDLANFDGMAATDKTIINTIYANYGKALQAYIRKMVSRDAPFDRFVAGDNGAISASAIRGVKLFLDKGCVTCHSGPAFTDNKFHALAVPQTGPNVPAADTGRFGDVPAVLASIFNSNGLFSDNTTTGRLGGVAQDVSQTGQFRTKGLRNVATSAPYMHAGQLATLADVITFYNAGGGTPATGVTKDALIVPLSLSTQDQADLVEFLNTLTGQPIPASLEIDTSR